MGCSNFNVCRMRHGAVQSVASLILQLFLHSPRLTVDRQPFQRPYLPSRSTSSQNTWSQASSFFQTSKYEKSHGWPSTIPTSHLDRLSSISSQNTGTFFFTFRYSLQISKMYKNLQKNWRLTNQPRTQLVHRSHASFFLTGRRRRSLKILQIKIERFRDKMLDGGQKMW